RGERLEGLAPRAEDHARASGGGVRRGRAISPALRSAVERAAGGQPRERQDGARERCTVTFHGSVVVRPAANASERGAPRSMLPWAVASTRTLMKSRPDLRKRQSESAAPRTTARRTAAAPKAAGARYSRREGHLLLV